MLNNNGSLNKEMCRNKDEDEDDKASMMLKCLCQLRGVC